MMLFSYYFDGVQIISFQALMLKFNQSTRLSDINLMAKKLDSLIAFHSLQLAPLEEGFHCQWPQCQGEQRYYRTPDICVQLHCPWSHGEEEVRFSYCFLFASTCSIRRRISRPMASITGGATALPIT